MNNTQVTSFSTTYHHFLLGYSLSLSRLGTLGSCIGRKMTIPQFRSSNDYETLHPRNDPGEANFLPGSPNSTPVINYARFPTKQMLLLAICRFSEPISMTSGFPYLFFMIRDFHLSDDEKQIGRYAGLLASSFTFAQFLSGFLQLSNAVNFQDYHGECYQMYMDGNLWCCVAYLGPFLQH